MPGRHSQGRSERTGGPYPDRTRRRDVNQTCPVPHPARLIAQQSALGSSLATPPSVGRCADQNHLPDQYPCTERRVSGEVSRTARDAVRPMQRQSANRQGFGHGPIHTAVRPFHHLESLLEHGLNHRMQTEIFFRQIAGRLANKLRQATNTLASSSLSRHSLLPAVYPWVVPSAPAHHDERPRRRISKPH